MIELKNLGKVYRTTAVETQALEEISLKIDKGEFVSIMGPSGCGKTTLLNTMGLLDKPSEGKVLLNGIDTSKLSDRKAAKIRNKNIGFIFQNFHLIRELNVVENVELPLFYRSLGFKARRKKALELIEQVGLSHREKHYPSELSGGQCQRVAIARALAGDPSIILADEPTGNLDSHTGNDIMELLHKLNTERNATIAMVTHDESLASSTGRVIRLYDGRLIAN